MTDEQPSTASRRSTQRTAALVTALVVGAVGGVAVLVAGASLFLRAVNPVGDEWQCADGEQPAVHDGGGTACFAEGSELPAGYRWDPWGNRPLASNCDRDGWTRVRHARQGEDCVREGTELPDGWSRVTEG